MCKEKIITETLYETKVVFDSMLAPLNSSPVGFSPIHRHLLIEKCLNQNVN